MDYNETHKDLLVIIKMFDSVSHIPDPHDRRTPKS